MKTFKQLIESLRSPKEVEKYYLSKGRSQEEADTAALTRSDREEALHKVLRDPTRSAEEHGQAVRMLRRLGEPTLGGSESAKRKASKLRRQPKPSYIKSISSTTNW
jgi:hypothetical protein